MQKKSKETLKQSKSPILQHKFGSQPQKWPKIAKKNGSLNCDLLKFYQVDVCDDDSDGGDNNDNDIVVDDDW